MNINAPEKILRVLMLLLIASTSLLSLSFPSGNRLYPFLLLFAIAYWQKERLRSFFQKIKNPQVSCALYLVIGWLGAILLEFTSGRLAFNPKPVANLIIGLGFYLPYFAIFLKFINRYQFNLLEVFYLSGLGKLIFDLLISRKLLITPLISIYSANFLVVAILTQAAAIIALFGSLTTLPLLLFPEQESECHKPLKEYLVGMTPIFLATGAFIVWAIILKIVFTPS